MMGKPTLLVTGASGHLGRRVVELLLEANAGTIIAATRTPDKLADFAAQGVVVRRADFDDLDSLTAAFAGVDRLLLVSTDALGEPGRRLKQHQNAVQAADAAGVKHVVYTGIVNPYENPALVSPDHSGTEEALKASGVGFTVLRENLYTENLLGVLGQAAQMGRIFSAAGAGKTAYITREDCAQAAAAALASSFEGRRVLDITGPEALTQDDVAAIIGGVIGKPVEYVPLSADVMIDNIANAGLPRPVAELIVSFDVAAAAGTFSGVTSAVEDLTGRKPISTADFLASQREAQPSQ